MTRQIIYSSFYALLLVLLPCFADAARYSDKKITISMNQFATDELGKIPFNVGRLQEVIAHNRGKNSDLYCEHEPPSPDINELSCVIDLDSCDPDLPFVIPYDLKFSNVDRYYLKDEDHPVRIQLKNCEWFDPEDLLAEITYYFSQPQKILAYEKTIEDFFVNKTGNNVKNAALPESSVLQVAFVTDNQLYTTENQAFVEASKELSAVYTYMASAAPRNYSHENLAHIKQKSVQYAAYTTFYANNSLQRFVQFSATANPTLNPSQVKITGLVGDFESNVGYLAKESESILNAIRSFENLTETDKNTLTKSFVLLQTNRKIDNESISIISDINKTISANELQ